MMESVQVYGGLGEDPDGSSDGTVVAGGLVVDEPTATVPLGDDNDDVGAATNTGGSGLDPVPEAAAATKEELGQSQADAPSTGLACFVETPERKGDGLLDSHVVYTVRSEADLDVVNKPGRGSTGSLVKVTSAQFHVLRRYSDFFWLHEVLEFEQPSYLVPPLPPKHHMNDKFDPEFLEIRRRGLQEFVHRIATHPVMSCNGTFRTFLQAKSHELVTLKKERERSVMTRMQDTLSTATSKLTAKAGDDKFSRIARYIDDFQARLTEVAQATGYTVTARKDMHGILCEYAVSFGLVAETEDLLSEPLRQAQRLLDEQAEDLRTLIRAHDHCFFLAIKEYLLYTESIKALLLRREIQCGKEASVTKALQGKEAEKQAVLDSDQKMTLGSLFGKDPEVIKREKLDKIEAQMASLTAQYNQAVDETAVFNANVQAELDRWHREKDADIRRLWGDLADAHVTFLTKAQSQWAQMAEAFEQLSVDE
eukprot:m.95695 g.95695  ORF g.95695 m.95695 type:complete len:480 (+) comp15161_c0_seq5:2759-4198(+)